MNDTLLHTLHITAGSYNFFDIADNIGDLQKIISKNASYATFGKISYEVLSLTPDDRDELVMTHEAIMTLATELKRADLFAVVAQAIASELEHKQLYFDETIKAHLNTKRG